MTEITIKVHQHYVTTRVRFWYNSDAYAEFCVCSHEFPRWALQQTSERDLYESCHANVASGHSDFPTFPYPAYLLVRMQVRYDRGMQHVTVCEAKYSEFQRGIMDFTGAFTNSLASADLTRKVLDNLASMIASRNAEGLNKLVLTLRAASGGTFKKLT
jgi:hypothetical protein